MRRLFLFLVLFGWLGSSVGEAQIKEFNFRQLPNMEGLSSYSVTCMAQDSLGYIWIGTTDGLNRYDGYEVEVYRSYGNVSSGLTSNEIATVFIDSKNRVWVGTQFGISLFDPNRNSFITISSATVLGGLLESSVTSIQEDQLGRLLVSAGHHLYYLNEESQKFEVLIESPENLIMTFIPAHNGLWYGLENGSVKFHSFYGDSLSNPVPEELIEPRGMRVTGLVRRENSLWVGYESGGLARFDQKKKVVTYYMQTGPERHVSLLYLDRLNRLWSCDYAGLKLYNEQDDRFFGYYHDPAELNSIRPNITGIFLDKQGNYYFYFRGEGVYVSYSERGFKKFDTSPLYYWHVKSANITAITEEENGNLWLGGYNGAVDVFDWINGRMVRFNNYEGDDIRLGVGTVFSIFRDSQNLMWIGSHSGGLRCYNPETGILKIYQNQPDEPSSLIGNDVRSIAEDEFGNLWIVIHGKGVSRFNRETERFTNFTMEQNNLASNWVESVVCDSMGFVWVGSTSGLSLLAPGDSIFKNFTANPGNPGYMQGSRVISLKEGRSGVIWVCTNDGLYEIDHLGYEFKRLGEKAANQYICSIEKDHNGLIWFSTLDGLYQFNPQTEELFQYSENDGLQADGFNLRSSYYNGKTELFFGGTKGVNLFNPDKLQFNSMPPQIVFSEFALFNKKVDKYHEEGILKKHISQTKEIVLDYDQNVFTIGFTALNMINPGLNKYAYRMENFESDWNYVGIKREATYTNLNPGKYVFRVKASNNDGVWNEKGISLQIRVRPPWYRTHLFYFFLLVLVIALPVVYYQVRTAVLRRQKRRLVHLVAENTHKLRKNNDALKQRTIELDRINYLLEERQHIIEQQSDELEKQANNLKQRNQELKKLNQTKDRLFSIIAHDLRAPFNTILGFSSLLVEQKDYENREEMADHARYIHDASLQVFNLLENLLFWARSQSNEIQVNILDADLDAIVSENVELIRESLIKKGLGLDTDGYVNYSVKIDVDMMRTVVRNLILNAIKFTPKGGIISIASSKSGSNMVKLSISDTGVGISTENIKRLTIVGEQVSTKGTEGEKGSGLGLLLCNEFVIKNQGRLVIESEPGQGSTFSVLLPASE